MPRKMGAMMAKVDFKMNGMSKIYDAEAILFETGLSEAVGAEVSNASSSMKKEIVFHGDDLIKGNWLFCDFVLKPDTLYGIMLYEKNYDKGRRK